MFPGAQMAIYGGLLAIKKIWYLTLHFHHTTTQVAFGFNQNFGQNGSPPGLSNPQGVGDRTFLAPPRGLD